MPPLAGDVGPYLPGDPIGDPEETCIWELGGVNCEGLAPKEVGRNMPLDGLIPRACPGGTCVNLHLVSGLNPTPVPPEAP
eukprot:Gb_33263 [translate_table: standard]